MLIRKSKPSDQDVRVEVRGHYGKIAAEFSGSDAASCCEPSGSGTVNVVSQLYQTTDVEGLPPEVTGLSLGCGDPVTLASLKVGQTVLDLGSGGGIDCFLAAKRVGDSGRVIGVDMTAEMIEKARASKAKLGVENVEFRLGEIEHLPVADGEVDVVLSNCVINLSPDKLQVFREAFRALRPGGTLSVSDIVTNGPLPAAVKEKPDAWSCCVAGALEVKDYTRAIRDAGFVDVELAPVYMDQEVSEAVIGPFEAAQGFQTVPAYQDARGTGFVDLGEEVILENEPPIFSAKVTARKPN